VALEHTELARNRVDFGVFVFPMGLDRRRAVRTQPAQFRDHEQPAWRKKPPPLADSVFESHVVHRPFRPDHVKRALFERQLVHRCAHRADPLLQAGRSRVLLQLLQKLRDEIHRGDLRVQFPG